MRLETAPQAQDAQLSTQQVRPLAPLSVLGLLPVSARMPLFLFCGVLEVSSSIRFLPGRAETVRSQ